MAKDKQAFEALSETAEKTVEISSVKSRAAFPNSARGSPFRRKLTLSAVYRVGGIHLKL
jgi:hypothetical protein